MAAFKNEIAQALIQTLVSPNEADRNGEVANIVDGLFAIARAINRLAQVGERTEKWRQQKNGELSDDRRTARAPVDGSRKDRAQPRA